MCPKSQRFLCAWSSGCSSCCLVDWHAAAAAALLLADGLVWFAPAANGQRRHHQRSKYTEKHCNKRTQVLKHRLPRLHHLLFMFAEFTYKVIVRHRLVKKFQMVPENLLLLMCVVELSRPGFDTDVSPGGRNNVTDSPARSCFQKEMQVCASLHRSEVTQQEVRRRWCLLSEND